MIRSIRGLGSKGLIIDQNPYDIPIDAISDGNNIRVSNGKIEKITGARTFHTGSYYHMAPWFPNTTYGYVLIGASGWDKYTAANTYVSVTPTGTVSDGNWSSSQIGEFLIVNNATEAPFVMHPTDSQFASLTNWPANTTCSRIKYYNGYLVAIGLVESSVEQPYVVRWSDAVQPNTLQPSWDFTSTTNLAGRNELSGSDGPALELEQLNDQMIIYMRDAVYSMQYIGGNFVFSFRKAFDDDGIITPGAVASFKGGHLVVGNDDIYLHDGNSKRSISDGRVTDYFYNSLQQVASVKVQRYIDRDEIWIAYSTTDQLEADKVLIYNYQYDAWTQADLPQPITQLAVATRFDTAAQVWSTTSGTWADQAEQWATINPVDTDLSPYFVAADKIWQGDFSYRHNSTDYVSFIEQEKLDLDQLFGETQSLKKVKRVLPQISGTGSLNLQAGATNTPNGAVAYPRTQAFNIETDYKADLRAQGRYLAIKMQMENQGHYSISGWDLDLERGHGR